MHKRGLSHGQNNKNEICFTHTRTKFFSQPKSNFVNYAGVN